MPAAEWSIPVLSEIARERYGMAEADLAGRPFNTLCNYAFSQG